MSASWLKAIVAVQIIELVSIVFGLVLYLAFLVDDGGWPSWTATKFKPVWLKRVLFPSMLLVQVVKAVLYATSMGTGDVSATSLTQVMSTLRGSPDWDRLQSYRRRM